MTIPTRITDLSATALSNPPAGTDTIGTNLDDYYRAAFQIMRGDFATKGADIISASTTDLGAVQGIFHDITGTVTITSLGTVAAGIWKWVKFEGALTLTHNATSLILLTGANRTTAVGDVGLYMSEGSGNWREMFYANVAASGASLPFVDSNPVVVGSSDDTKKARFEVDGLTTGTTRVVTVPDADITLPNIAATVNANTVFAGPTSGAAAAGSMRALVGAEASLVLLSEKTASSSTSLIFTSSDFSWSAHDVYEFEFIGLLPGTTTTWLRFQVSEDAGGTYKTGATDYLSLNKYEDATGPTNAAYNNTGISAGQLFGNSADGNTAQGSTSASVLFGRMFMYQPNTAIKHRFEIVTMSYLSANASPALAHSSGQVTFDLDTNALSGIKFLYSSGNIASGTIRVYGRRKA